MNEAEEKRIMKQKYLKEQIKTKSWNPEEFSEFLGSRKENGLEIDSWEFDELIYEVEQFEKMKAKTEASETSSVAAFNLEVNSIQNKVAFCLQSQILKDKPENKNVVIMVQKDPGKYEDITLKVMPEGKTIKRSLNDVNWLRSKLQIEFPFYYIPPVKSKDYKENFVQNFFNRLVNMKFLKESEAFKNFIDDGRFSLLKNLTEEKNIDVQMMDKISKMYDKKETAFDKNTEVYEAYFKQIMDNFSKVRNNLDEWNPLLKNLSGYCETNSKTFSSLKHLSYELGDSFEKSGEILSQMSKVYKQYISETEKFSAKVGFKNIEKVKGMNNKVYMLLKEWSSQVKTHKTFVLENLANFFHFRKHEYLSVSELVNINIEAQEPFRKKWAALEEKKKSLFAGKNIEKWKVNLSLIKDDLNTMMKDYNLIRPYMLPDETAPLLKQFQLHLFLNKHVLFEYVNFYLNSQFYTELCFSDLTEKMIKSFQNEESNWNKFYSNAVDISMLDRESTMTIRSQI